VSDVPQRLLARLDALGGVLRERGDAIALLGLGSVGADLDRLDDHSDLDFFAIVDDGAKQRYLDDIDWLEALHPVAYSFENSVDGRKVLWTDGLFAEYAVFTLPELRAGSYDGARLVWRRDDAPAGLEHAGVPLRASRYETPHHQLNEIITNLYVGLHRELRGERLAAFRLIQVHAIDRLLTWLDLTGAATAPRQDPFAVERGAERRLSIPFGDFITGYERNRDAAIALLNWLEPRADVDATLADAIRALGRCSTVPRMNLFERFKAWRASRTEDREAIERAEAEQKRADDEPQQGDAENVVDATTPPSD
jgi:hypothetical protein